MRVRALKKGYYDLQRRHEGEEFDIHDTETVDLKTGEPVFVSAESLFSSKWMEKIPDAPAPLKGQRKPVKKAEPVAEVAAEAAASESTGDANVL